MVVKRCYCEKTSPPQSERNNLKKNGDRFYHENPAWIHPKTAAELGVREDDWVWIEVPGDDGRIRQKVVISPDFNDPLPEFDL